MDLNKLQEAWEGINRIRKNPELWQDFKQLLKIIANKDNLTQTPEGKERSRDLMRSVKLTHRLYCEEPRPGPDEAREIINELCEMQSKIPEGNPDKLRVALEKSFAIH